MHEVALKLGVPHRVHTNNGTHFKVIFDELCNRWRISHSWSTPYYPQGRGRVERTNQLITVRLRKQESGNWDRSLAGAVFAINTRKRRSYKYSSLEPLCGMKARCLVEVALVNELNKGCFAAKEGEILDDDFEARIARMADSKQEHAEWALQRASKIGRMKKMDLQVGDEVMI